MTDEMDEAIRRALLYLLQWSNDEYRKLGPLASQVLVKALKQDGYTVVKMPRSKRSAIS
jgi:uncharacterized protein YbgA (DUF1722 family)